MKERIALLTIILSLWVFLFIFQNYMSTRYAIGALFVFMVLYTMYMQIAFKHKTRKQRQNPKIVNENFKPFVSVMIPAHNEATVIEKTVENVLQMDYERFEVIVIDDRSDDNTAEVLKEIGAKYENVKILIRDQNAFPGKSAVLNEAMSLAKGEAILVFDADARVNRDFLTKLVPGLENKEVGALQARKVIRNYDYNFLTRCQNNEFALDTHFQVGRDAVKGAVELRGDGELIKRDALIDIGGWNNYTITDDLDMSTRLHIKGWDVRFVSDVCVYEEGVISLFALYRQRRRWIEGSIRRYLEHFADVMWSSDVSLRVSLDMTAYITEFVLPFWLISELVFQAFRFVKGVPNTVLSSITLTCILGIFFFVGLLYSLRKYNNIRGFENIKQSVETSLFILVIWLPTVMYIVPKMIFCKKTMDWGKTAHGVVEEPQTTISEKEKVSV